MELRNIRYFLFLAKIEHVSQAADLLNISQPSLSKAIHNLEDELEVKLFDRVGNHIRLNENGRRFYEFAQQSLSILDAGIMTARNSKYDTCGKVTVENWIFAPIVVNCVAEYLQINPLVNFNVSQNAREQGEEPSFIIRGIAADTGNTTLTQDGASWIVQPLFTEGYVLIMAPGYMDIPEDVTEVTMDQFRDARFIVNFENDMVFHDITYSYCREAGFFPHIYCKIEDFISKMTLVSAGVCVSFVPESCVEKARGFCPGLRVFHIAGDTRTRTVGVLRKQDSMLNEAEQDFWDFMMDYYHVPENKQL